MKKSLCIAWALGWAVIFLIAPPGTATTAHMAPRSGVTVVVFPVRNATDQGVWESKYYPGDILPDKLGKFFRQILKDAPLVEVREGDREPWLSGQRREGDLAVDLEIYRGVVHEFIKMGRAIPEAGRAHADAARALKQAFQTSHLS